MTENSLYPRSTVASISAVRPFPPLIGPQKVPTTRTKPVLLKPNPTQPNPTHKTPNRRLHLSLSLSLSLAAVSVVSSDLQKEKTSRPSQSPSSFPSKHRKEKSVDRVVFVSPWKMAEETVENLKQKQKEVPTIPRAFSRYGDGRTIEECQEMIAKSFRNPTVKFLIEHLENAGCFVGKKFIKAVECDKKISGGYVRGEGIMVCSNHMNIQDEVNQVVIHELIHAYDDCLATNLDWANCAHHACSEIRAGHLSGDCHYKRELLRGFMKIRGHEQECVRRRVMKSVTANPYCSESAARDAMEAVWDVCYNDTKPFDRAP